MVFLAITPAGLREALGIAGNSGASVWCGADAISEDEYRERRSRGLSRFNYDLSGREPEVLACAMETIHQHHPESTVWVEAAPSE